MDALAFSGPGGARILASALRTLSGLLEAGTVSLQSIETSSSIDAEDCSVQHIGITYVLSGSPGVCQGAPSPPFNS